MSDKKNKERFSIYFNLDDNRQVKAMEILNAKGRKKARFITDLILANEGMEEKSGLVSPGDKMNLGRMGESTRVPSEIDNNRIMDALKTFKSQKL